MRAVMLDATLDTRRRWERLVSHSIAAWMLENGAIICIAGSAAILVPAPRPRRARTVFVSALGTSCWIVWSTSIVQRFYTNWVYSHMTFFSGPRAPLPLIEVVKDYFRSSFLMEFFNALVLAVAATSFTLPKFEKRLPNRNFSALGFLVKFAVVRFLIDVAFYACHRTLHHRNLYWLHRRHHEHFKPTLDTNFHFHPVDIFIEASMPTLLGLGALEVAKVSFSKFEVILLVAYVTWHETGAHCGKPVPTVTYFPPLAPLYRLLLGNIDAHGVQHHDVHHALPNCNYGITIWPDNVFGTRTLRSPIESV